MATDVRAPVIAAALVLTLAALGCGGTQSAAPSGDAVIRIECPVGRAVVVINDREVGTVETLRRGIRLSPGNHRIELRHPDYHSHYEVLALTARERRVVEIELAERLP